MVQAYGALSQALVAQGSYPEAEATIERGLALTPSNHPLHAQFRQQATRCRRLRALEVKLAALCEGKTVPADVAEQVDAAWLCQLPRHKRYAAAVRFFGAAFATQPAIMENARGRLRYVAACAAARSALGTDRDAVTLTEANRSQLRAQALSWLEDDLSNWARVGGNGGRGDRRAAIRALRQARQDRAFAGLREPAALKQLPEAERALWSVHWATLEQTLAGLSTVQPPEF
jgi:hypothetical protein